MAGSSSVTATEELKLNRKLQNHAFQSWRLSHGSLLSRGSNDLPAPVVPVRSTAVDYLHTRASVLHNHLLESHGRLFCFMAGELAGAGAGGLQLAEVAVVCGDAPSEQPACTLRALAGLARGQDAGEAGPSVEAPVDPSLAVVDTSALTAAEPTPADGSTFPVSLHGSILVSSGNGDVCLLYRDGDSASGVQEVRQSAAAYPLRPLPPLAGHRTLVIEAAYALPNGQLRCIAWAVRSGRDAPATSHHPHHHHSHPSNASCETFVITLQPTPPASPVSSSGPGASDKLQLAVVSVTLLRASAMAPHLAMVSPARDAVLLGLDPDSCSDEAVAAAPEAVAECREQVTHIDCTRSGAPVVMDEGDDDMDPRTLQEAAARLAKYTADEGGAGGEPPQQQWSDVYKESGPDGVGAMGAEPAVDLIVLPAAGGGAGGAGGGGGGAAAPPRATWHLTCGASKLLTAEAGGAGLLGLSDDVDCAVVTVSWPEGQGQQGEQVAQQVPRVVHEGYVPALAYVAAGKVHKKHLLLGRPHGPIAAVLIEATKLYYVYRRTASRQEYGLQDIVDMELDDGESVLGARLVELPATSGGADGSRGADGAAAAAAAHQPAMVLLLLTQRRMLLHHLQA